MRPQRPERVHGYFEILIMHHTYVPTNTFYLAQSLLEENCLNKFRYNLTLAVVFVILKCQFCVHCCLLKHTKYNFRKYTDKRATVI